MAGSVLAVSPAGIVGKRLAEGPGSGVEPAEFEPQASLLLAVCGPQMLPHLSAPHIPLLRWLMPHGLICCPMQSTSHKASHKVSSRCVNAY